jgi:glycosyltransferase involved in cell wall biosynthesis
MKILISAYSCEPAQGSERGVGWNVVREVARYHEVWVLTRPDESREAIEKELSVNPISTLHFVYFTLPFWQDSLSLGQSGAMQLHYYLWQIQAYFVGRNLHQKMNFDAIHHVTFVRYSCPSFLSLLPIPFVWGPVGGGESAPLPFWTDFTWKNKLYEIARLAWRSLGEIDLFTHITSRRSKIAYAATEETAQRLKMLGVSQVEICPAIGLSTDEIDRLAQSVSVEDAPIRFISIGRLLHWKGFHLGLRAFAKAKLNEAEYWIIGDGPELERLQSLALDLGIIEQVHFWGELGRNEVLHKIGQCSVLVHPSLHDSGAGVCLEAMATAKPIICLNLGGPAAQIITETGCKVPAENPEQAVCALGAAMVKLAGDKTLCMQMGKAGQERVRAHYSWEAKAKRFANIYKTLAVEHTSN